MKGAFFLIFGVLIGLVAQGGDATGYPDISLTRADWKYNGNVKCDNGVLEIAGTPKKSPRAELNIIMPPVSSFYITGEVKTENVEQGFHKYNLPMLKAYISGHLETRDVAFVLGGNPGVWEPVGLLYKVPGKYAGKQFPLTIRLTMENCSGKCFFRNLKISSKAPQPYVGFPFKVPASPELKLSINTRKFVPFNNNLLGLNSHFMETKDHTTYRDMKDIIALIKVPLMRFPGGTVANWYDYETDMWVITDQTETSSMMMNRLKSAIKQGRKFGFDDYLDISKKCGFSNTIVLNLLHDSPEKCVQRIHDRKKRGLDFSWVELGNENYDLKQQSREVKDVNAYIKKAKAATAAIKKAFPDLTVAVNVNDPGNARWTIPMSRESFYDAVVFHPYAEAGHRSDVFTASIARSGLSSYKQVEAKFDRYRKLFKNKPFLATEWGVLVEWRTRKNHWAALATAEAFFALIKNWEEGALEIACLHILKDGYIGLYDGEPGKMNKRSYGVVYDLMIEAFLNNMIYAGQSTAPLLLKGQPAAFARAVKTGDGTIKVFAVNLLPEKCPLMLTIDGKLYSGEYSMKSFSEEHLFLQKEYPVNSDPCRHYAGQRKIVLPPYSVSVVSLDSQ